VTTLTSLLPPAPAVEASGKPGARITGALANDPSIESCVRLAPAAAMAAEEDEVRAVVGWKMAREGREGRPVLPIP
jgi:hypothetical protein